jgi:hypothetical protein
MRRIIAAVLVAGLAAGGCGDDPPAGPSPAPINLAGLWRGNITVLGTSAQMIWTLTQNNQAVTGPVTVTLRTGIVLLNGNLSGTLSGTTLTYTIAVPPGGIIPQPTCSGQLGGTATAASPSTINGSYAVISSTCATGLTSGTFTLAK